MRLTARTRSGLAYEMAGSGPPVLLMHAGIDDRRTWDPQWESLAVDYTVIRYDSRGFGASVDPVGPYTAHGDALDVLDALELEQATLVGVSMNGTAALDLALAVPSRVRALAVVNATPSGWQHTAEHIKAWDTIEAAYNDGDLDRANELELRMWVDGPMRSPGDSDRAVRAHISAVNRVLLERQGDFKHEPGELYPPAIERMDELDCPILVVTGELDQPSVLAGAFEITRATGAEHIEIEGAAHLPNLERPDEFMRALRPFLAANA